MAKKSPNCLGLGQVALSAPSWAGILDGVPIPIDGMAHNIRADVLGEIQVNQSFKYNLFRLRCYALVYFLLECQFWVFNWASHDASFG